MPSKIQIEKKKLFLVEGADAYYFFIYACQAFNVRDIQVIDFGGITEFYPFLKNLRVLPGYEKVSSLLIARDAEKSPENAVQSIKKALNKNGFAVPKKPFVFAEGSPRVAFMVLPGLDFNNGVGSLLSGTLEDLCLSMTKDDPIHSCVDIYVNCLKEKGVTIKHTHKTRLHTYLAGKNKAGLKIGEAARAGAWDWNHSLLNIFRETITRI